jgi:dethiobiotin synthetase
MGRIVFITGTDTGVGKTLLTALLLVHLRAHGCHALGMKPFCSGPPDDVRILHRAQQGEIPHSMISPFQFAEPVAPLLAARMNRRRVSSSEVVERVHCLAERCELLLVEGAGGLLAPLGENYSAAEVIKTLRCPVLLAAGNKLGAINHSLLTLRALRSLGCPGIAITLMDGRKADLATQHNHRLLSELAAPTSVIRLPFLGPNATSLPCLKKSGKKIQKTLALLSEKGIFSLAVRVRRKQRSSELKNGG